MIPEKDIDLITRFFDLDLSYEELKEFEKRLLLDRKFREKCEAYKAANDIINNTYPDKDKQERTDKWKTLLNDKETIKPTKKTSWKWLSGIAAGFILLISIWQLNKTFQEPDMNALLADSWNKKIGLNYNITRSTNNDTIKTEIIKAYKAYNNTKYKVALNQLKTYKSTTPYYEDVLLIRGLSLYKNNKAEMALKTLDSLSKYHTGKKALVANWYLGLIYLEQGNVETAELYLELPSNKYGELKVKE